MERKFSPALTIAFCILLALSAALSSQSLRPSNKERFLIPPPEYIEYFHFGFNESMADSFWLRWIQDLEVCMTYTHKPTMLDQPTIDQDEARFHTPRYKNCDNSWAFKMLDTVTKLAPRYLMAYIGGAVSLSVLVEDYEGASVIFDRGTTVYPKDWTLLYRAAYHFLYDRKDFAKAARLLEQSAANGAPIWVKSLASRLYTKSGQVELGLNVLQSYRAQVEGNKIAEQDVDKRIAELKKQLKEP